MRWIQRILCTVLGGILGLGCGDDGVSPGPGPEPEYGVPRARFRLDGVVRARLGGGPLRGIRVLMRRNGQVDSTIAAATGDDGRWAIDAEGFPCGAECRLLASDPDGPLNGGSFADTIVVLNLEQTAPGSGSWFAGTFEQHDIEVQLSPAGPAEP